MATDLALRIFATIVVLLYVSVAGVVAGFVVMMTATEAGVSSSLLVFVVTLTTVGMSGVGVLIGKAVVWIWFEEPRAI